MGEPGTDLLPGRTVEDRFPVRLADHSALRLA